MNAEDVYRALRERCPYLLTGSKLRFAAEVDVWNDYFEYNPNMFTCADIEDDLDLLLDSPETTAVIRKGPSAAYRPVFTSPQSFYGMAKLLGRLGGFDRIIEVDFDGEYEMHALVNGGCSVLFDVKRVLDLGIFANIDAEHSHAEAYWNPEVCILDPYDFSMENAKDNSKRPRVTWTASIPDDAVDAVSYELVYRSQISIGLKIKDSVDQHIRLSGSRFSDMPLLAHAISMPIPASFPELFSEDDVSYIDHGFKYLKENGLYALDPELPLSSSIMEKYPAYRKARQMDSKIDKCREIWFATLDQIGREQACEDIGKIVENHVGSGIVSFELLEVETCPIIHDISVFYGMDSAFKAYNQGVPLEDIFA